MDLHGTTEVHDATTDFLYREPFLEYQEELDTKHDRHERLVKLSRDCTIRSKRVIFLLHRVTGNESSKEKILAEAEEKVTKDILSLLKSIALELMGEDPKRYHSAFSPGLQEFIEALSYLMFLKHGHLVKIEEIQSLLTFQVQKHKLQKDHVDENEDISGSVAKRPCFAEQDQHGWESYELEFPLDPMDYVLGVADLTGELMRLAINSVGCGDRELPYKLLPFMRAVYCGFLSVNPIHREFGRKIVTLKNSLLKVESVCYTLKIRGSEVPEQMLAGMFTSQIGGGLHNNNTANSEIEQF